MPKKSPKQDHFRPTKVDNFVAPKIPGHLSFTAASYDLSHPKARPDEPGKPAPRLTLAYPWSVNAEYPRDNGHDDETGWRKTWLCPECGHVARFPWTENAAHFHSARSGDRGMKRYERSGHGRAQLRPWASGHRCPKGCAWMVCIGAKLRVPRKAKLKRWLRKQAAKKQEIR